MLTERELWELFESTGAVLKGHFLLSSGLHSPVYIQCAKLLQYSDLAERVCRELARKARDLGPVGAVVGPALGGIVVAYELARALGVRGMFTEREGGVMRLRRGFEIVPGERILIAEDVVTTGRSSLEVAEVVREAGGEPVGIACLVDRRPGGDELPLPVISLLRMELRVFDPGDCPLCREGIPLVKPGSRQNH